MSRLKLGVIFGGMSTENEVSCVSGNSVIHHLNSDKYDIKPIYIDSKGVWYEVLELEQMTYGKKIEHKKEIDNVMQYLRQLDVVFPALHGLYGEDGTIQGLLELIQIPYVGCKVLASSVGMDKVYSKIIFEKAGLKQANYKVVRKRKEDYLFMDTELKETKLELDEIARKICKELSFPMFVKPSNSGSSVGIKKVKTEQELIKGIEYASQFDSKILIEQGIIGKEVECAVLGNENVVSSCVGEIKPADEFYSYEAKYQKQESRVIIPAEITKEQAKKIQKLAIKAFKAIDGKGLSRVDFFVEEKTQEIYLNEINTLPGFTEISMYPKLFEAVGISYKYLLDKLIELALEN